jgi:hypothetical protein
MLPEQLDELIEGPCRVPDREKWHLFPDTFTGTMSSGSEELFQSLGRFVRAVGKAASAEMPSAQRAAGRVVRDDLPRWQRTAERLFRSAVTRRPPR